MAGPAGAPDRIGKGHRVMVSETTPMVLPEGHSHTMGLNRGARALPARAGGPAGVPETADRDLGNSGTYLWQGEDCRIWPFEGITGGAAPAG